jgi:hypothetical protein
LTCNMHPEKRPNHKHTAQWLSHQVNTFAYHHYPLTKNKILPTICFLNLQFIGMLKNLFT